MKTAIAAVALLCTSAAPTPEANPNHQTYYSDGTPPVRFQGDASQVMLYLHDISQFCGTAADPHYTIIACTREVDGVAVTALPNPCQFDNDPYAHLACHEMGHVNGWPANHGD